MHVETRPRDSPADTKSEIFCWVQFLGSLRACFVRNGTRQQAPSSKQQAAAHASARTMDSWMVFTQDVFRYGLQSGPQ